MKSFIVSVFILTICTFLGGCTCVQSIKVTPEATGGNIKKMSAASIKAPVEIELKDCCPGKEERKIACQYNKDIYDLWTMAKDKKISIKRYYKLVKAAETALQKINYYCPIPNMPKPAVKIKTKPTQEGAWKSLKKVNEEIEKELKR